MAKIKLNMIRHSVMDYHVYLKEVYKTVLRDVSLVQRNLYSQDLRCLAKVFLQTKQKFKLFMRQDHQGQLLKSGHFFQLSQGMVQTKGGGRLGKIEEGEGRL